MVDFIGAEAIDRGNDVPAVYTIVGKESPSLINGLVTLVQVWASQPCLNFEVGIFYEVGMQSLTTRSTFEIGAIPAGFSEHQVSLSALIGDYIGMHATSGKLDKVNAGEGYWSKLADLIPCTGAFFDWTQARTISLRGLFISPQMGTDCWALLDIHHCQTPFQIKVTSYTDALCHLRLRWSTRKPRRHDKPRLRRGIRISDDIRFCFTVFDDIDQVEDGDTLVHTFYLPVWPDGTQFWFYFWGTVGSFLSPSTSAIFSATRVKVFQWLMAELWSS
ncbi:hypothetical protein ES705_27060 [subsurface metagenome]